MTALEQKLARLETMNDQLETELTSLDELLRRVGFSNGIATVKATASEILVERKKPEVS
jgi:endonuclease III